MISEPTAEPTAEISTEMTIEMTLTIDPDSGMPIRFPIKMSIKWIGGKHAGTISVQETFCQALFTPSTGIKSKCFSDNKFESMDEAVNLAKDYQKEMSIQNGLTKNQYRIVSDKNFRLYLEVKLQNDLIMKCDMEHLPIVEERIWTGNKSIGKYTYYVKSRESKKRDQEYALFHRRAYPELSQVDHINRDGLDNRKENIRECTGRVNANKRKQKNNKSGVSGVFFEDGDKARWRAQWTDVEGKKRTKSFACAKWGKENAYEQACQWRNEKNQEKLDILNMGE